MSAVADGLETQLAKYEFYHRIEVAPGVVTKGWDAAVYSQKPVLDEINRRDMAGQRVLDVGCRDGLFSFAAEKRGAAFVLGIDNNLSRGATEFLIPHFGSKVQMREINVYDFESAEKFDVVIFPGVLYHLRFPFYGLKRLADVMRPGGTMIIETAVYLGQPNLPMLYCPDPNDNPYKEPTSVTFYNHLGMVAALKSLHFTDIRRTSMTRHGGPSLGILKHFRKEKAEIGRAVYTATYSPSSDAPTKLRDDYWYRNHTINSEMASNTALLSPVK